MKVIKEIQQPEAKFDLYFLGYDSPKALSHGNVFSDRSGLIELTRTSYSNLPYINEQGHANYACR